MKYAVVAIVSAVMALPAVTVPTAVEAQVLAGRGAARAASRAPRVSREDRITNRLYDAEEQLAEIDEQLAALQPESDEAEGEGDVEPVVLTSAQERQLADLTRRKQRTEQEIERLKAQLDNL